MERARGSSTTPKPAIVVVCKDEIWWRCCGCESLNINDRDGDEIVCPDCGQVNIRPEIQLCDCECCQKKPNRFVPADPATVRVSFECPECHAEKAVNPSWMADNGSPLCTDCDIACDYVGMEIRECKGA